MAAILADEIFNCIFWNENDKIPIQISLKLVPRSPIDNKSALVQVMACRLFRRKQRCPVYWRIYASALEGDELSNPPRLVKCSVAINTAAWILLRNTLFAYWKIIGLNMWIVIGDMVRSECS